MFGWASLLSSSRLQYALIGSDGSLFMNVTANIGTVAYAGAARSWGAAALACMGVVFGDIGTSPLYALSAAAKAVSPVGDVSPQAVLGIVSLIFWSLIIVISIKYAILLMRADNHGEGGILALLALISPRRAKQSRRRALMVVVGLIGAALLYGDGTITPAISVLSAIEGIKLYAPQMDRAVVPLTVIILALLFAIQRNGTSWIGGIFGPVMLIWFVVMGVLGIMGIARTPAVLAALSPLPAITYLWHAGPVWRSSVWPVILNWRASSHMPNFSSGTSETSYRRQALGGGVPVQLSKRSAAG
jgi:KUP system potassium uptake protein